jgi:hypothetical protein
MRPNAFRNHPLEVREGNSPEPAKLSSEFEHFQIASLPGTRPTMKSTMRIPNRTVAIPYLNKPYRLLFLAQRLHDPIDTVSRQAKNGVYVPFTQSFDQDVGGSHFSVLL